MAGSEVYEAIVVGGGAAGLSAALILGRACRKVLVFDDGRPRNAVAERMHGFITRDGTPPLDLLAAARSELHRYPSVQCEDAHVESVSGEVGAFAIRTHEGHTHQARRLLLATGVYDALPAIDGLRDAWGRSAFVCPYCDAWEVRGKRIAAIGKGAKAVELAQELRQWSHDIVVCTQGGNEFADGHRRWLDATNAMLVPQPIRRIHARGGRIASIEFEGGRQESCEAIFLSTPLRPRYPLVDMLGCALRDDGEISVDARGRTSVAGVYAAGDAVTTVHQVVLAAASGVCAAIGINEDCLKDDVRSAAASPGSGV